MEVRLKARAEGSGKSSQRRPEVTSHVKTWGENKEQHGQEKFCVTCRSQSYGYFLYWPTIDTKGIPLHKQNHNLLFRLCKLRALPDLHYYFQSEHPFHYMPHQHQPQVHLKTKRSQWQGQHLRSSALDPVIWLWAHLWTSFPGPGLGELEHLVHYSAFLKVPFVMICLKPHMHSPYVS